jgi:cytochrome P450
VFVEDLHFRRAAQKGDSIDIQNVMMRFTLDSISEIAFGRNIESLQKDVPFTKEFAEAQKYTVAASFAPVPLHQYLAWKRSQSIAVLEKTALAFVKEKRDMLASGQLQESDDVLARYLVTDPNVSDEFLRDTTLNFLIAGRDTTAVCLTWACYLLSQNPEAEDRMVKEIVDAFQGDTTKITYESLRKLPFTEAVIKETLRLYPSVPVDQKISIGPDTLPSGIPIVPNTAIVWSAYCMGRHPDYWDDALAFKPERWLGSAHRTFGDPSGFDDGDEGNGPASTAEVDPSTKLFKKHPWQVRTHLICPQLCIHTLPRDFPRTFSTFRFRVAVACAWANGWRFRRQCFYWRTSTPSFTSDSTRASRSKNSIRLSSRPRTASACLWSLASEQPAIR